jgi:hypothetical protein
MRLAKPHRAFRPVRLRGGGRGVREGLAVGMPAARPSGRPRHRCGSPCRSPARRFPAPGQGRRVEAWTVPFCIAAASGLRTCFCCVQVQQRRHCRRGSLCTLCGQPGRRSSKTRDGYCMTATAGAACQPSRPPLLLRTAAAAARKRAEMSGSEKTDRQAGASSRSSGQIIRFIHCPSSQTMKRGVVSFG